jgi:hypothetical protein
VKGVDRIGHIEDGIIEWQIGSVTLMEFDTARFDLPAVAVTGHVEHRLRWIKPDNAPLSDERGRQSHPEPGARTHLQY